MTASVRIGHALASTAPAQSQGSGVSRGGAATKVRLADVTAKSGTSSVLVRLGDVTAVSGQSTPPKVRLADVSAYAVQNVYTFDGSEWVLDQAANVSVGRGRSTGSGTRAGQASSTSVGKGRSTGSGKVAFTGTLALSGGGTLGTSGAPTGPADFVGGINISGGGVLTLTGSATQGPPGAGSVTVVPEPLNTPPRVRIELTGFLGSTVTVVRIDQAGNVTPIRLANPATLDGGTWLGYDYEAPFQQIVTYQATATLTVTSDPVVLDVSQPWLIHPGIPDLSQPIQLTGVPQKSRATNQGVHNVLGRRTPIIITDGARRAPTFDLMLHTDNADQEDALNELLDDASVLLLQIAYPGVTKTSYQWVGIDNAQAQSLTDIWQDNDTLQWTLSCTETDYPDGLLQAQRTLADVASEFATLGDLANNYATLRDIITDTLIGS